MINKILLLVAITASFTFGAVAQAAGISIEIGDRPYYSHGPRYYSGEWEMVWVPGHWSDYGHHWVHGHYRRGQHRHHRYDEHVRYDDRVRTDDRVREEVRIEHR